MARVRERKPRRKDVREMCKAAGLSVNTFYNRLARGMSEQEALTLPPRVGRPVIDDSDSPKAKVKQPHPHEVIVVARLLRLMKAWRPPL